MTFDPIEKSLANNIEGVYKLAEFDRVILDMAIDQLKVLEQRLNKDHFIDNPQLTATNTRTTLENIRTNDSLKSRFEIINNQCVVLLVSLFASAIGEMYRLAIVVQAITGKSTKLNEEELKFSVEEIVDEEFDIRSRVGQLIADKKGVSFQDMKSIGRSFKDFFEIDVKKDKIVNNIIMAQAGRHVIVHERAAINDRILRQVSGASPRSLMPTLPTNGKLLFSVEDLHIIGDSMLEYFHSLSSKLKTKIENDS